MTMRNEYQVPVTWKVRGFVVIEAESMEDAVFKAENGLFDDVHEVEWVSAPEVEYSDDEEGEDE